MLFGKRSTLSIELVPKSAWGRNLRTLLESYRRTTPEASPFASWDFLRKQAYANAGNRCEICSGRGPKWPVECHEVWEYRAPSSPSSPWTQRLVRLIALCPDCHQVKHIGLAKVRGMDKIAIAHLRLVNGWTDAQVAQHILESNAVWVERSKKSWVLDLGGLLDYGVPEKDILLVTVLSGDKQYEDSLPTYDT